jgi:hypothetical protein
VEVFVYFNNSHKNFMRPIVFFICLLAGVQVFAQEKIDTDRPDQTESAVLVPKKYFQGEFGINKENFTNGDYNLVHPTFLLKYGISKRFEFRLEGEFVSEYQHLIPNTKTTTELQPIEIGTKIALFEEKGLRPKTSLIAHVGLPLSLSGPKTGQGLFPSFRFTFQHSLSEKAGLGYNFGAEWDGYGNRTGWLYTLAPGFDIGENWYLYVEAFGNYVWDTWQHGADLGIAYYISNDTKLDLSAGLGLGNNPLKNYIALGFSFRFLAKEKFTLNAK